MLKMPGVFSSHMVLQRGKSVSLFGWCDPGQAVRAELRDPEGNSLWTISGDSDDRGYFLLKTRTMKAGGPYTLRVESGDSVLVFEDVMYGEVWIAAGQSNMEFELRKCRTGAETLRDLSGDRDEASRVRFYYTVKAPYPSESYSREQQESHWCTMGDETAGQLSAVGYYAARTLSHGLEDGNITVGVINCNYGGTSISCWMSRPVLESFSEGQWYLDRYEKAAGNKTDEEYLREDKAYRGKVYAYNEAVAREKSRDPDIGYEELTAIVGEYPWPAPMGNLSPYRPCGLYENMLSYIMPYSVAGVWYYQGEEDCSKPEYYGAMLRQFITMIREDLKDRSVSFIILQLPMYREESTGNDESWVGIRNAQLSVRDPQHMIGVVPLCDLGEEHNVHPVDKLTPGTRLGKFVLDRVYGDGEQYHPMEFHGFMKEKGTVLCIFDYTYGGIMLNSAPQGEEPVLVSTSETSIEGFEIAGSDGVFHAARCLADKGCILAYSEQVPDPVTVRYAYRNFIRSNVYNKRGVPLLPFCSSD